ncbi:MAG: hypothetical protein HYZ72_00875 [Deltaproteobacteria bacterium]|nr:hypothetical protein [Deltaproteobacteria bacterium]
MQWVVAANEEAWRLDTFLAARLRPLPRRDIVELIARGQVLLNGRPGKKGLRVRVGDTVTAPAALSLPPNPALPIDVVYADDTVLVLDKPAGIPSLALRHSETDTVANFLVARFPETVTAGPRPLESGVVHRLDTATSGLLLAARTRWGIRSSVIYAMVRLRRRHASTCTPRRSHFSTPRLVST